MEYSWYLCLDGKWIVGGQRLIVVCDVKSDKVSEVPVIQNDNEISRMIYIVRNQQVMLDSDLAALYQVETRALNQAVRRNSDRFPERFCFQLTRDEYTNLKSQIVISSLDGDQSNGLGKNLYFIFELK